MQLCLARHPDLKVFSLPRMTPERHVELGVRGNVNEVQTAIGVLQQGVSELGFSWNEPPAAAPRG
jgi:hypothetical protein